jgi:hypothetical protein
VYDGTAEGRTEKIIVISILLECVFGVGWPDEYAILWFCSEPVALFPWPPTKFHNADPDYRIA